MDFPINCTNAKNRERESVCVFLSGGAGGGGGGGRRRRGNPKNDLQNWFMRAAVRVVMKEAGEDAHDVLFPRSP